MIGLVIIVNRSDPHGWPAQGDLRVGKGRVEARLQCESKGFDVQAPGIDQSPIEIEERTTDHEIVWLARDVAMIALSSSPVMISFFSRTAAASRKTSC